MKASYYNVFFPYEDNYVLFNTLRGSIFVVDSELKDLLEKNEVSSLGEEYTGAFSDTGILVQEEVNEEDQYKLMYEQSKYNTVATTLHVITTYSCNLACTYCYEGKGELEHKSMDEKTARCAVEFIKRLTQECNSKSLSIELFGGEPMLNMPMNLLVAEELTAWCEETSTHFSLNAITNGTLSSEKNVEDLAQYSCRFLVTVDGPKEIHDQRRVYKNEKGTFDDITEGLFRVRDAGLGIMLRINVDEVNKDHVVTLYEFLKDEGLNEVLISIKPVFNTSPACLSYGFCMPDVKGLQVINSLYTVARKMNFRTEEPEKPSPQGACSAQRMSYFTVDPYLRLFKCAILPPYEKNSVGVVNPENFQPVFNHVNTDFLTRDPFALEGCRTCQFIPICRGGCPVEAYETQGTTHVPVCRKDGLCECIMENLTSYVKKND